MANAGGIELSGRWWSQTIVSVPLSRASFMRSVDLIPQSSVIRRVNPFSIA